MRIALLCVLVFALAGSAAAAQAQPSVQIQSRLRPQHPRLLVLDDQLQAVSAAIASDPLARQLHDRLLKTATGLLSTKVNTYVIGGPEHTLLSVSRNVEGRVMLLAGLYRLDHDPRFARRAIAEMRAAAAFPDWYPRHFLDTAEMTAALGIGYDWCFDALSPDDRAVIRQAIVEKGLDPGIARMQPKAFFSTLKNNWVQVCYGGLTVGALAVAEDEPDRADEVISHSIPAISNIMKLFAPDGGFEEGPAYWDYATTFNTYYLAALDTALGTDFDLASAPGFADTGSYRIQTISPLWMCANFGDCDTRIEGAAQMFWMGRRFNRPDYILHERAVARHMLQTRGDLRILELLWQFPLPAGTPSPTPLDQSFQRIAAGFMRTSWGDPQATYLAFKGGDSKASHGHLDLGQFICEMSGQRWAVDLGAESYGVPGYFGGKRWDYFRTRTEAHNTLTIDDANESLSAKAPLSFFSTAQQSHIAIANLDACYPGALHHWQRGVTIRNGAQVVIQDELVPARTVHVVWHFHTRADVAPAGNIAKLQQGGASVWLHIQSPTGCTFTRVDDSHPAAPNSANPDLSDVQIKLPATDQPATIAVELTSTPPSDTGTSHVTPLQAWPRSNEVPASN